MEWLVALITLTLLEIVLGIDNIIFISLLAGKLPADQQAKARTLGLLAAMITRVLLLFSLAWMIRLTAPLFTVPLLGHDISGRDLILLVGGLFLLAKGTFEIHEKLEGAEEHHAGKARATFGVNGILDRIRFHLRAEEGAPGQAEEEPASRQGAEAGGEADGS